MGESVTNILVIEDAGKQEHLSASVDNNSADAFLIGTGVEDAEDCCRQPFHPSMVTSGLSKLGRSASGSHQVYQTLTITHTDLQDPQAIAHCQHILQLQLSGNCLTTLQPLSQLQHLTRLDVSHNLLSQVLDYGVPADPCAGSAARHSSTGSSSSSTRSTTGSSSSIRNSNLRRADLSYNMITQINELSRHSNLQELLLAGNQIWRVGRGLEPCSKLRKLDLSSNRISSCHGLQDLCCLQDLCLDGNHISSLQPLSGLSSLQLLSAAHNQVTNLDGIQGLSSLRLLDVGGNQLRRVEALAACRGLSLLTYLNVSGNPLEAAQDARLHVVHLLTQLQQLDGLQVSVGEKVDAGNMVGAATDGLVLIRRQFFPQGELEDGGGAVPPTAAGLKASGAEEERSCSDAAAMFAAIDRWARSVQPALALQPLSARASVGPAAGRASLCSRAGGATLAGSGAGLVSAQPEGACVPGLTRGSSTGITSSTLSGQAGHLTGSIASSRRSSSSASRPGSRPGSYKATGSYSRQQSAKQCSAPGGAAAVAARLAAGCCPEAPYRQLQLLRACYCWVLSHVMLPRDCDLEAGADAVTWDVGRHLFGEQEQQVRLHEAVLPGYSGTWAECVSQVLVSLLRACHMEAVALSGFWKAGGRASVEPGEQLASHNHSWVAAKVNGCWRLLDPVYSLIMAAQDQPLPFFLPPKAFIHTHLPFEPCWQLLPQPVRAEEWWAWPALALGFAAAGGRLLDGGSLSACTVMQLDREDLVWPAINIPIAAPVSPQQRLRISLLDSNRDVLASWQQSLPLTHTQHTLLHSSQGVHPHSQTDHCSTSAGGAGDDSSNKAEQEQQYRRLDKREEGSRGSLVFQQHVLGDAGILQTQAGPSDVQLGVQQLWAALPGPGTFYVKVEQVTEVPGGLMPAVHVEGLQQPLSLTLRQTQDVLQLKVVVKPAAEGADCTSRADSSSRSCSRRPLVAYLPQPQPASAAGLFCCSTPAGDMQPTVQLQLLTPQPGSLLEADRTQDFAVLAPASAAVAVGSGQSGWVQLQTQDTSAADAAAGSAAGTGFAVFAGSVVLPRVNQCFVAVGAPAPNAGQESSSWAPMLGLHVWPPVQDLVPLPEQPDRAEGDNTASPTHSSAGHLLTALDVDGDGAASRRDMLLAFRRDRQLADHLKMPAKIRADDGTFDTFLSKFVAINRSGLGLVNSQELAAYFNSLTAGARSSSSLPGGASRVATAVGNHC